MAIPALDMKRTPRDLGLSSVGHIPTASLSVTSQPSSAIYQKLLLAEKHISAPEKVSAQHYLHSNHCTPQKPSVNTFSHHPATENCSKQ